MMNNVTFSHKVLVLAVLLVALFGVSQLSANFAPPSAPPTAGNSAPPIHSGGDAQVKSGGLSVDALSVPGHAQVASLTVGTTTLNGNAVLGVEGRVGAAEYCNADGSTCVASTDLKFNEESAHTATKIWDRDMIVSPCTECNGVGGGCYCLFDGEQFSDYDEIHYLGHREGHGAIPGSLLSQKMNQMFINQTFSGDDTGFLGLTPLSDRTFDDHNYRKGVLREIWGINY